MTLFSTDGDRFTNYLPKAFPYRVFAEVMRGMYLRDLMVHPPFENGGWRWLP